MEPHEQRKWDIRPKQVVVAVLALILLIFAMLNTQHVTVDFIVGDASIRLIFVIAGSAVIGFLIGWFLKARADRGD